MNIVVLYAGSSHIKSLLDRCVALDATPILVKADTPVDVVSALNPDGIIITGSPWSVFDPKCPKVDHAVYELGIPVLGICYGMQRMALDLGGDVARFPAMEKGKVLLSLVEGHESVLYAGFTIQGVDVWMAHSIQVRQMPDGFVKTGETAGTFYSSMEREHLFAVQFHPEKDGLGSGKQVLNNFFTCCQADGDNQ